MEMKEFFNIVNDKIEKYNLIFKWCPADGVDVVGNKQFKFIEFDYDIKTNQFSSQLKRNTIANSMQTIKCIQELSLAGEILEVLKYIEPYKLENPIE